MCLDYLLSVPFVLLLAVALWFRCGVFALLMRVFLVCVDVCYLLFA